MQQHDCPGGSYPSVFVVTIRTDRGLETALMTEGSEEPLVVDSAVRWVEIQRDVPVRCPICWVPLGPLCDGTSHLTL